MTESQWLEAELDQFELERRHFFKIGRIINHCLNIWGSFPSRDIFQSRLAVFLDML